MKKSEKLRDKILCLINTFWFDFERAETREKQVQMLKEFIEKLERQYWTHKLVVEGAKELRRCNENG